MANKRRIGILTGGGDVPGLNVAIKAVAIRGLDHGLEVVGLRRGWASVLEMEPDDPASVAEWTVPLDGERVRTYDRSGGTALHTSRTNPSRVKPDAVPASVRDDERVPNDDGTIDCTAHAVRVVEALDLDALVPIGGEDTLSFADRLHHENVSVVAIPKTMDNDVFGTDYCIGFSTAVSRSVEAINALRTTVGSHERIGIVELFGRRSGETALLAGFLAQVDRTVIAEIPADLDVLLPLLAKDKAESGAGYAMCVISEGAVIAGEGKGDDTMRSLPGSDRDEMSVSRRLGRAIKERLGFGTVIQELAYLMRAGEPDAMDRMVGLAFGGLAVQLVARNEYGRMVALKDGNYSHVPIGTLEEGQKSVDVSGLYDPSLYRAKLMRVEGMPMFLY
jgi:6-phosphofructokinase 1